MVVMSPQASVFGAIAGIAAPALLTLALFHITGDPRLQPLGLTEERMTRVPPPVEPGLVRAELHVPVGARNTDSLLSVARQIKASFAAKGQDAWVLVLRDPQADRPFVVYKVGVNMLGPYRLGDADKGVKPALLAVRTIRPQP